MYSRLLLHIFIGILLVWSHFYVTYGIEDRKVQASFHAVQVAVSAIIFRATFKLADSAIMNKDKTFNWDRGFLCLFNFLVNIINLYINVSYFNNVINNWIFFVEKT